MDEHERQPAADAVLRLRCACGWETSGSADEVVAAAREHGRRLHNMEPTREEVMAMAAASDTPDATLT